ncbi:unnamed protein product, partial [Mesorhabditis belari]|uniref:Uncharacterized protein n=1 Tax=Mesorhabditis belari TaxID=2138241 RepID=A0AAF3FFQ3_9BILA
MYTSTSHEKLSIRVERGTRPSVKCSDDKRKVQITVPQDATQNWPPIRADLFADYFVVIQRLQQQFKIYVQNTQERKPEFVIYSSTVAHEKEVKTQIKELHTRLNEVCIAAPNLDLHGVLKAPKLSLESTVGTMHIYARIESEKIRLHAQTLVLAPEALISTNKLKMVARKVQIDGRIFPSETGLPDEPRVMSVICDAQLVHIGVDGRIGEGNSTENLKQSRSSSQPPQLTADGLLLQITGSLANYGKILAIEKVDLVVSGSIVSLSDGWLDSASRGYDALKQIKGIKKTEDCKPSSSSLHSAIREQNPSAVAKLIESGVDTDDKTNSKRRTLRQTAIAKYREAKEKSTQNKSRQGITLINALLTVHEWRRGTIQASVIQANIEKDCADCAQFKAEQLQAKVGVDAAVEADSIWHCSHVELEVGGSLSISGQVKHKTGIFNVDGETTITSEAILSHEVLARLTTKSLLCDGIWSSGDTLVIESKSDITFKENSYVEAEKLESAVDGCCSLDGTWQIGALWMSIGQNVITSVDGKVFVEDSATINAQSFLNSGLWNVSSVIDVQLKDSCHCFHSSRIEVHSLRIACENHCTIGGAWVAEALHLYARHELVTTCNGKVTLYEGLLTCGSFRNDALWQVEKWMRLTTGSIEQSDDGTLFVKERFDLNVHSESKNLNGKIITSHAAFKFLKTLSSNAFIRVNEIEINLPYMNESCFNFSGQMDILAGSLTLKGNSNLEPRQPLTAHPKAAVILSGKLNATAIIAPFLAIELTSTAFVRLFGLKSNTPDIDFNVLISAGALITQKDSSLLSMGDNEISEGIICATTWIHAGQVRFQTNSVKIHTGSLKYTGRLTSAADKQNHVTDLHMIVDELLLNEGIISAHRLQISGDGILENRNRIFAVDEMNIRLSNFNNDQGLMESKNAMKLLAVSKEWTRVAGNIKAKSSFDVCAQRLNLALQNVQNLCKEKHLEFSAKEELMISSNVIDSEKKLKVACSAKNKIIIDACMEIEQLEILLGDNFPFIPTEEPHQFSILNSATIDTKTVFINGNSPLIILSLDGVLKCQKLEVSRQVRTVLITGKGSLECAQLQVDGEALCVDLYQTLTATEILCPQIEVKKKSIVRLSPPPGATTRMLTDRLLIAGTMFVDQRLYLTSISQNPLQITGSIIGTSTESEITIESDQMILNGELSNLAFLEIYVKNAIKTDDALTLQNIKNLAIEAGQANLHLKVENCKSVTINGDQLNLKGFIKGIENAKVNFFAASITQSMEITNLDSFEIQAKRQVTLEGKISKCKSVNIDAKWITNSAKIADCEQTVVRGWCSISTGSIMTEELTIVCLSVFINNGVLHAENLKIITPFLLSMTEKSDVFSSNAEIHTIICACNHEMVTTSNAEPSTTYLWIDFERSSKTATITEEASRAWRETATMLKDRMKSNTTDVDETILALKYIADLSHARVTMTQESELFLDLNDISTRFSTQPISLFSVSKFSALIANARSQARIEKVQISSQDNAMNGKRKNGKRRSMGCTLYEGLVQFKSAKYNRESRNSSETVDGGYVSRGSSEDLERKSNSVSPLPSPKADRISSAFPQNHLSLIASTFDESLSSMKPSAEELNDSFMTIEEAELLEFEELEQEIENEENGHIRTDYIICEEEKIRLAQLRERNLLPPPPRPQSRAFPLERTPSSNDLVMKRIKVKSTLSSLDLRSFGSNSSLNSIDFCQFGDLGSPMQFPKSTFQRSFIPRGPFRHHRPRIPESPLKN